MASIVCINCGETRSGRGTPKNTKRCWVCSTTNQLQFVMSLTKKMEKSCELCSGTFTPRRRDEVLCADCDFSVRQDYRMPWECISCHAPAGERNKVLEGIPICKHCFQDPVRQPGVIATLHHVIDVQREKNNWQPPVKQTLTDFFADTTEYLKPHGEVSLTVLLTYLLALHEKAPKSDPATIANRRAETREGITRLVIDLTMDQVKETFPAIQKPEHTLAFLQEPEWEALIHDKPIDPDI